MMGGKANSSNEDNNESSSSNNSVSQKTKMKKFQLTLPKTKTTSDKSTNNERIGLPKPKIPAVEVIDLVNDSPSPVPRISQIARLYEAKLRKIERIKPLPPTSTLVTKFFEQNSVQNDDDDFDNRPVLEKSPVLKSKPQKKRTTRATKRGIGENFPDIRKLVNPNYSGSKKQPEETDPEPMKQSQDLNETSDTKRIRKTLEQYGFKGAKNYEECDIAALFGPSTKRKKIRPTLLMKKNVQEQQRILAEKVGHLLSEEYKENVAVPISEQLKYETISFFLENYLVDTPEVFYKNSNGDPIVDSMDSYYTAGLFPISDVKAGYLLKDWTAIPGRERSMSPERNEITEITDEDHEKLDKQEQETVTMEVDEDNETEETNVTPVHLTESKSSVNQQDLDNIQSRLMQGSSSLNGSCEDLFADYDDDDNFIYSEAPNTDEEGKSDF